MRNLPSISGLSLIALLMACSPADPAEAPDSVVEAEVTDAAPPPAPEAAPEANDDSAIPTAMLGVWDYIEGSCDPASDLRLEITPEMLTFYESVGEVRSIARDGDDVTFTMAMEGEGEVWEESLTYRLIEGGEFLESNTPDISGDGNLRRKRCES